MQGQALKGQWHKALESFKEVFNPRLISVLCEWNERRCIGNDRKFLLGGRARFK